jgi:hypothetical protein
VAHRFCLSGGAGHQGYSTNRVAAKSPRPIGPLSQEKHKNRETLVRFGKGSHVLLSIAGEFEKGAV